MIEVRDIDMGEVERSFDAMIRRGRNLGQAFRVIKPEMRADQRDHARAGEGPEGAWEPLAQSTLEKRASMGRLRRRPLGRLTAAVTYAASKDGVIARSKVPWSGAHQDGAVVGRGSHLPARPFLWLSDKLISKAKEVIARVVEDAWGHR